MGLKLHPRTLDVQKKQTELKILLLEFLTASDLSDIEFLQMLNEEVGMVLKYMLRHERHPHDFDKKADEA
jgi:hypothetical protein